MKKILFIPALLIAFFSENCQKPKTEPTHSVQVNVVADITDPHYLLPDADPILKLYGFDNDRNAEGYFRISTVTDKHLNPAIEYYLPAGSVTEKDNAFDDPNYREKVILAFYDSVRKAVFGFDAACHIDSSLGHSEVFNNIASELLVMKTRSADKNVLLVFSDLQENSNLFSCYSKSGRELLYKKPDKVAELFADTHLLPDSLKGFTIIFIYQPKSREDDQKFGAMIDIYTKLLEPRRAFIKVQANNDYLN